MYDTTAHTHTKHTPNQPTDQPQTNHHLNNTTSPHSEHGFFHADPHPGNLLACRNGDLCYLDFGMVSTSPEYARYAIISHVVHLVNRDYPAMCRDYYDLQFMDRSVDTAPIAPALQSFFDDVLGASVSEVRG